MDNMTNLELLEMVAYHVDWVRRVCHSTAMLNGAIDTSEAHILVIDDQHAQRLAEIATSIDGGAQILGRCVTLASAGEKLRCSRRPVLVDNYTLSLLVKGAAQEMRQTVSLIRKEAARYRADVASSPELAQITRSQAADRIEAAAREGLFGRFIQERDDGWSFVFVAVDPRLASWEDCPGHIMPAWAACAVTSLIRNISPERLGDYGVRFADALRCGRLDDDVRNRLLVDAVEIAAEYAAPFGSATAHWGPIQAVCSEVCSALRTGASKDELERLHGKAKDMFDALWPELSAPVTRAILAAQIAARPEGNHVVASAMAASTWGADKNDTPAVNDRLLDTLIEEMLRDCACP